MGDHQIYAEEIRSFQEEGAGFPEPECTMKNPNCDGDHCTFSHGEVRVLPYSADGNLILCRSCFNYEILWRKDENRRANRNFETPNWGALTIYGDK